MKKSLKKVFGIILATATVMMSVCACGDSSETEKKEIVVTFMNGEQELGKGAATAGVKLWSYSCLSA